MSLSAEMKEAFEKQDLKLKGKLEELYQQQVDSITAEEEVIQNAIDKHRKLGEQIASLRRAAAMQTHEMDGVLGKVSDIAGKDITESCTSLRLTDESGLQVGELAVQLGIPKKKKKPYIHPLRMRFNLNTLDLDGLKKQSMLDLGCQFEDLKGCTKADLRYMLRESYKVKYSHGRCYKFWLVPHKTDFIGRNVTAPGFDLFSCLVILCNAVFIGFAAEYAISHYATGSTKTELMVKMEDFFYAWYVAELLLKLKTWRLYFFMDPDDNNWMWNSFDMFLVLSATWDIINKEFIASAGSSNMTWLRLLRLLKMLKMLRMVRVMRFFRELRLMLYSVVGSFKTLLFGMSLLGTILYVFSLAFLQGATAYLKEKLPDDFDLKGQSFYSFRQRMIATEAVPDPKNPIDPRIFEYFGSLDKTFLSLYQCITRGVNWEIVAEPLKEAGDIYYGLFMFFILFTSLGVINVIKGIFTDAAAVIAQNDRDAVIQEEMAASRSTFQEMREAFLEIEPETQIARKGLVSWEQFVNILHDERVQDYLETFGIDDPLSTFKLCENADQMVDPEEFISACTKVRGIAKSLDIESLTKDYGVFSSEMGLLMGYVQDRFNEMQEWFAELGDPKDDDVEPLDDRLLRGKCVPATFRGAAVGKAAPSADNGIAPHSNGTGPAPVIPDVGAAPAAANEGKAPAAADAGESPVAADVGEAPVAADVGEAPVAADVGEAPVTAVVGEAPVAADNGAGSGLL